MVPEKKDKNLWKRYFKQSPIAGQIATLVTLLIAAIFVFIAITINVGRVSQKKTQLSTAADGASLQLTSQLGSYAHFLSCQFLKCKKKKCKFSWSLFFKGLLEGGIMGITITAFAGTVFNGLQAGITGNIEAYYWGKMNSQFKKMSKKMRFREGAIFSALQRAVDDPNRVTDIYDDDKDGLKDDRIPALLQWYQERLRIIDKKITRPQQEAIDDVKSSVKGFDEKAQAFEQFIHDPTVNDAGGTKGDFVLLLEDLEGCGYPSPSTWDITFWAPGNPLPEECENLFTSEECEAFEDGCEKDDDSGEEDDSDESDDSDQVDDSDTCASCNPYDEYKSKFYHDQVDTVAFEIMDAHEFAYGDDGKSGFAAQETDDLSQNIDVWRSQLYDESSNDCPGDNDGDYYNRLGRWIDYLAAWQDELRRVKAQAETCMQSVGMCQTCDPVTGTCSYDENLSCCCKLKDGLSLPQRIDSAIARLDTFRNDALQTQTDIAGFNSKIDAIEDDEEELAKGQTKRKAAYSWQDTYLKDGNKDPLWHHVRVEVEKFKVPRIKTYVSDFMKCAKVKHAKQKVWIKIWRYDQGRQDYPFWKFFYHNQGKEPSNPETWEAIPEEYWLYVKSKAKYSYKKKPPRIVQAK